MSNYTCLHNYQGSRCPLCASSQQQFTGDCYQPTPAQPDLSLINYHIQIISASLSNIQMKLDHLEKLLIKPSNFIDTSED
jgi:hypothetical protein